MTWLLSARTGPADLVKDTPLLVKVSCRETRSKYLVLKMDANVGISITNRILLQRGSCRVDAYSSKLLPYVRNN